MGIRAYCCHPLLAGDRLLGTLSFASHTRDRFDETEVEFMNTICHYVAMAKERARLLQEARAEVAIRREAEENLLRANERIRLLFERSHDGILIADDTGRFLEVNQSAASILGYLPDELQQMGISDLQSTDATSAGEQYTAYQGKGYETGEFGFIRPDGHKRVIEYSATRLGPNLHLSIIRDVTSRKRMEAESARSLLEIEHLNQRLLSSIQETHHRVKNNLQILAAMVDLQTMDGRDRLPAS